MFFKNILRVSKFFFINNLFTIFFRYPIDKLKILVYNRGGRAGKDIYNNFVNGFIYQISFIMIRE